MPNKRHITFPKSLLIYQILNQRPTLELPLSQPRFHIAVVIKLPFGGAAESQDGSGGKDRVVLSGPSQVS